MRCLKVVSVIPKNEIKAYEYEIQLSKDKTELQANRVKGTKVKDDGNLLCYYGGSVRTIIGSIKKTVASKSIKAEKRKAVCHYDSIDLCVCVQDGSLMDLHSYKIAGFDFDESVFDNIFFVTPSYFFRYTKASGFEEYSRIV